MNTQSSIRTNPIYRAIASRIDLPIATAFACIILLLLIGCLVALVCDHRVGARNPRARIGLNEVALGLRFPPVLLQIAAARVTRVEEVVLGSKLHDPESALRLGLLDELADDAAALERAEQVLKYLESLPREAYAAAKRDLRARHAAMDHEANRAFLEEVLPVWTSDELKARILKMLQR